MGGGIQEARSSALVSTRRARMRTLPGALNTQRSAYFCLSPAPAAPLVVTAAAAAAPPMVASSTSSPNAAAPTRAPLTFVDALGRETETENH